MASWTTHTVAVDTIELGRYTRTRDLNETKLCQLFPLFVQVLTHACFPGLDTQSKYIGSA